MTPAQGGHARTLLFATRAPFATAALRGLIGAGAELAALVLPDSAKPVTGSLPVRVAGLEDTLEVAREAGVPVLWLNPGPDAEPLAGLRDLGVDFGLVACFPYRLPRWVVRVPRRACLNLHPSLLPRYRGPAPLFWQLRAGERRTGVSLHHLADGLDDGPVAARVPLALPSGWAGPDLERLLAHRGVAMYLEVLRAAVLSPLPARPQREARATYQGWPDAADFHVPLRWSARRAFDFMCGTREWRRPYVIVSGARTLLRVAGATAWDPEARARTPITETTTGVAVRFARGILHVVPA